VYCLPSLGEPFGVSALEAMASGLPVVSTTAGGLGHLVPDEGGIKVAPRDPAALADALISLLRDPGRRAEMGRVNREVVMRDYDWERVVDRLESFYRQLAAP
jgi:glycosyltransferase involved in cell wall biosynthesis